LVQAEQRHQHRAQDEEIHQPPQAAPVERGGAQEEVEQHRLDHNQPVLAQGHAQQLGAECAEGGDQHVGGHRPVKPGKAQWRGRGAACRSRRPPMGGTLGAGQPREQRAEIVEQPGRQSQQQADLHHGRAALPQQFVLQVERHEQQREGQPQIEPQVEQPQQQHQGQQGQHQRG
jgi:hypothetical protein